MTARPIRSRSAKAWKLQDDSSLTADDVAASWRHIIFPPPGVLSARQNYFSMVDSVESAEHATTVVFRLKFATGAFLPALADPFAFFFEKRLLDADPHWYETHIMGSGPFRPETYTIGQSMTGLRDPHFYRAGQPYLDGFEALLAPKSRCDGRRDPGRSRGNRIPRFPAVRARCPGERTRRRGDGANQRLELSRSDNAQCIAQAVR